MKSFDLVLAIVCFAGCFSCREPAKQQLVLGNGYVYDRTGRVDSASLDDTYDKDKTVVTYLDIRVLDVVLSETPKGKIDRIIRDNPDWNFVFMINAKLADSSYVVKKLNQYECAFPVFLDKDEEFKENNHLNNILATTYIYKRGKIVNLGVIGSSKSFFDEAFKKNR